MEKGQQQEIFLNSLLALTAAGIFFASNFFVPLKILAALISLTFITAIFLLRRESSATFIAFSLLFFLLGALRFQAVSILPPNDISNFAGEGVSVSGIIRDAPRISQNADGSYSVRYTVDVESIQKAQEDVPVTGGLNVNARYKDQFQIPTAQLGDKISAYGTVHLPLNYNNPGQLDIVTMLKTNGVTASLSAGKLGVDIEYVEGSLWTKFLRLMAEVREHYKESMRQVMSNEDAAAIFAMLFGGYEGLKPELTESFTTTGIVHILSVSGSHMSLLAATTAWLCNCFGLGRWKKILIGFLVIFAYSVLSGFIFPVIRSAFMGFLVFFAMSFDYESQSRRSLTIIAMLLLLYAPLSLFHISFQLSFLATAGILYLAPFIRYILSEGAEIQITLYSKVFQPRVQLAYFLSVSISCTMSAVIFTQPIIAWYFNQLSISALISNIIVIPILEMIIIFGLLGGILGLIIAPLAKLIFLMDSLALGIAIELNKMIAKLPMSNVYFPTMNFFWCLIYYIVLLLIIQKKKTKIKLLNFCRENVEIIQGLGAAIVLIIAFNAGLQLTKPPTMQVHFIDVHQGDAALVITPNGHAMMFDTGGIREHKFDIGSRVDVPYLHHYGITKLDYIFLTHCHEDHAEGAGAIVKKMPVGEIITAGENKSDYAESMALSEQSPLINNLRRGTEGEIFYVDGVKIEIIFAPELTSANATGNEVSNVYKVTFGEFSFLFTGDLVKENEAVILREGKDVKSSVLKVGHHGSKTSSSEEFVKTVKPTYAVFCVGADNTFGHPRPEVVELMEKVGAKIYRTDKNGAIVFETDGKTLNVSTEL